MNARSLPYKYIVSPTSKIYQLTQFLGQGGFGTVYKATADGQVYALKLVNFNDSNDIADFTEEVEGYKLLSSYPDCYPYIVCLYDSFIYNNKGVIVLEYMDGDLVKLPPSDDEIVLLYRTLLEALSYIHSNNLAHRDLKPSNILRKGKLFKIGDLGLVCGPPIINCRYAGTPVYDSPYAISYFGVNESIEDAQKEDIWQLGMTLYELLYGRLPLGKEQTPYNITRLTQYELDEILDSPYPRTEPSLISGDDLIFLIKKMLRINIDERWTTLECLQYFLSHLRARTFDDPVGLIEANQMLARDISQLVQFALLAKQHNNKKEYNRLTKEINLKLKEGQVDQSYIDSIHRVFAPKDSFWDQVKEKLKELFQ